MIFDDIRNQGILIDAVELGLAYLRRYQGGHLPEDPEVKDDKTLVTKVDRENELVIASHIHERIPGVKIVSEEGTEIGEGDIVILLDPIDGTRAFSCGLSTSTVIAGIYDVGKRQVVGCVVGEAASGRVWHAFGDSPTELQSRGRVSVWDGKFDEQSSIFLDVPHGFTRKKRDILTHGQMAYLFDVLKGRKIAIPGSNGLIQALVANGGQKVAGSITTAIGGPWDVCGVKLVLNAGGHAQAFSVKWVVNSPIAHSAEFEERDPLGILDYDILICGNSQDTVAQLREALNQTIQTIGKLVD